MNIHTDTAFIAAELIVPFSLHCCRIDCLFQPSQLHFFPVIFSPCQHQRSLLVHAHWYSLGDDTFFSTMNVGFFRNIPWFGGQRNEVISSCAAMEARKEMAPSDIKFFGCSLPSFAPWAMNSRSKIQMPTVVNKELKKHARSDTAAKSVTQYSTIRFRPYVSKVPWHTGLRAFLSQFFPRYGHYCGPNWSSGKDQGSPVWDKRPIDWLDFCCYCHDIGYDTHEQAELLKADLAFLECLESPRMNTKGDPQIAHLYKTMCTAGLRNILIPYRQHLLRLQAGNLWINFRWLGDLKSKGWNLNKDFRVDLSLIPKAWLNNTKRRGRNLQNM